MITAANLGTQAAEKIRVSVATKLAEHVLADPVNRNRHDDESDKQQAEEKRRFSEYESFKCVLAQDYCLRRKGAAIVAQGL